MLNPGGEPVVSRRFLERLTDLAPSSRRLGLAMACAQPWRDRPGELPECYRVELEHARWVANAEYEAWDAAGRPGEGGPGVPIVDLEYLFAEDPEPILAYTLQLLAEDRPSRRAMMLASTCRAQWKEEPAPGMRELYRAETGLDYGETEEPPDWIVREDEYARKLFIEQYRAW